MGCRLHQPLVAMAAQKRGDVLSTCVIDYSDLLADMDSWGEEPPAEAVNELMWRVLKRMNTVLEEIRGEQFPAEGRGLPQYES